MTLEELNGAFVDVVGCVNPQRSQLSGYINGAQDLYSALVLNVDKQKSDNKREDPVTIAEMVSIIKCKGASDLDRVSDGDGMVRIRVKLAEYHGVDADAGTV